MVREFLESRLPCPSPFERVGRVDSAGPADSPA
jgi:hypothetical protein